MVKSLKSSYKYAFTIIELIFAIVVIAIAVISLPMITQVTQRGIETNIDQEAIFAASSDLMGATAGYWDENSMQDIASSSFSRVINLSGDCNAQQLRPGHINQPFHRRCLDNPLTVANDGGVTPGVVFDLDDATAAAGTAVLLNPNPDLAGYKQNYTKTVTVNRAGDIKTIQVTISDADGIITSLFAQSANIGEPEYYMRTF